MKWRLLFLLALVQPGHSNDDCASYEAMVDKATGVLTEGKLRLTEPYRDRDGLGVTRIDLVSDQGPIGFIKYSSYGEDGIKIDFYTVDKNFEGRGLSTVLLQAALARMPEATTVFAALALTNKDKFHEVGLRNTPLAKSLRELGFTELKDMGEVEVGGQMYPGLLATIPDGQKRKAISEEKLAKLAQNLKPKNDESERIAKKMEGGLRGTTEVDSEKGGGKTLNIDFAFSKARVEYHYDPQTDILTLSSVHINSVQYRNDPDWYAGMILKTLEKFPNVQVIRVGLNDGELVGGVENSSKGKWLQSIGFSNVEQGNYLYNNHGVRQREFFFRKP